MVLRTRKISVRDQFLSWLDVPVSLPAVPFRTHRETFRIAGDSIFIRSKHCDLNVSSEALGSAFLLPAAFIGRRISGRSADQQWQDGAGEILRQANDWWGWRAGYPRFHGVSPLKRASGVGLAFSLGVDSFYSCFFAELQKYKRTIFKNIR